MDDLAVARGDALADGGFLLKDKNLEAARRQRPGDRKPDHASADDNGFYLEHQT